MDSTPTPSPPAVDLLGLSAASRTPSPLQTYYLVLSRALGSSEPFLPHFTGTEDGDVKITLCVTEAEGEMACSAEDAQNPDSEFALGMLQVHARRFSSRN